MPDLNQIMENVRTVSQWVGGISAFVGGSYFIYRELFTKKVSERKPVGMSSLPLEDYLIQSVADDFHMYAPQPQKGIEKYTS